MTPDQISTELLSRIRRGDADAFQELFRSWYGRLADYAVSILKDRDAAEDSVQEVFVAIWNGRQSIPDISRLAGYLHRAVRNRALNQVRGKHSLEEWSAASEAASAVPPAALDALQTQELSELLDAALAQLPPRTLEVFRLSRDQQLTYPQIAETLDISVKTVETLMGRALKTLRAALSNLES